MHIMFENIPQETSFVPEEVAIFFESVPFSFWLNSILLVISFLLFYVFSKRQIAKKSGDATHHAKISQQKVAESAQSFTDLNDSDHDSDTSLEVNLSRRDSQQSAVRALRNQLVLALPDANGPNRATPRCGTDAQDLRFKNAYLAAMQQQIIDAQQETIDAFKARQQADVPTQREKPKVEFKTTALKDLPTLDTRTKDLAELTKWYRRCEQKLARHHQDLKNYFANCMQAACAAYNNYRDAATAATRAAAKPAVSLDLSDREQKLENVILDLVCECVPKKLLRLYEKEADFEIPKEGLVLLLFHIVRQFEPATPEERTKLYHGIDHVQPAQSIESALTALIDYKIRYDSLRTAGCAVKDPNTLLTVYNKIVRQIKTDDDDFRIRLIHLQDELKVKRVATSASAEEYRQRLIEELEATEEQDQHVNTINVHSDDDDDCSGEDYESEENESDNGENDDEDANSYDSDASSDPSDDVE